MWSDTFVKWPPLPTVIKTPLCSYKVVITSDFDDEDVDGHVDLYKGIIKINKDQCLELQWEALIHEIIHIVELLVGMKPLKDSKHDSDAERLAMGLCMIFAANGWIR
jgi:hypothetical protein